MFGMLEYERLETITQKKSLAEEMAFLSVYIKSLYHTLRFKTFYIEIPGQSPEDSIRNEILFRQHANQMHTYFTFPGSEKESRKDK